MNWKFWQSSDEEEVPESKTSKKVSERASQMSMQEAVQVIKLLETQIDLVMARNELLEIENGILRERLAFIDRDGMFS